MAKARLGTVSKSTVSQICRQLRSQYRATALAPWARWSCRCCSWLPSTCPPVRAGPTRVYWWPGTAPGSCSTSAGAPRGVAGPATHTHPAPPAGTTADHLRSPRPPGPVSRPSASTPETAPKPAAALTPTLPTGTDTSLPSTMRLPTLPRCYCWPLTRIPRPFTAE